MNRKARPPGEVSKEEFLDPMIKALEYLWKVNAHMRAYAVVVDCLTEKAIPIYENYGFKSLGKWRGHERMFFPMKAVGRLFKN